MTPMTNGQRLRYEAPPSRLYENWDEDRIWNAVDEVASPSEHLRDLGLPDDIIVPEMDTILKLRRLSLTDHHILFLHCSRIVERFYRVVTTPAFAPGATIFTSMELVVTDRRRNCEEQSMAQALDAEWEHVTEGFKIFGLRFPKDHSRSFALVVKACRKEYYSWITTLLSYGDLWHLVAIMVRPLGFELLPTGFYVRIPAIEDPTGRASLQRALSQVEEDPYKWATMYLDDGVISGMETDKCLLWLSNNPRKVSKFLDLDWRKLRADFMDETEAWEWVTASRFFRRSFFRMNVNARIETPLQSSIFAQFMTHWLPRLPWDSTSMALDRSELLHLALRDFDMRYDYCQKIENYENLGMWRRIAESLPEGRRAQVMSALNALFYWDHRRGPALHTKQQRRELRERDPLVVHIPARVAQNHTCVERMIIPWVLNHWREAVALNDMPLVTEERI